MFMLRVHIYKHIVLRIKSSLIIDIQRIKCNNYFVTRKIIILVGMAWAWAWALGMAYDITIHVDMTWIANIFFAKLIINLDS